MRKSELAVPRESLLNLGHIKILASERGNVPAFQLMKNHFATNVNIHLTELSFVLWLTSSSSLGRFCTSGSHCATATAALSVFLWHFHSRATCLLTRCWRFVFDSRSASSLQCDVSRHRVFTKHSIHPLPSSPHPFLRWWVINSWCMFYMSE